MKAVGVPPSDAVRIGGRARGAIFMGVFGAVWLAAAAVTALAAPVPLAVVLAAIAGVTLAVLTTCLRRIRATRAAFAAQPDTPERRRGARVFRYVNIGQWVLILVGINVLRNSGLDAWVVPLIAFIVGAHFLPLAGVFRHRAHLWTGGAMMAWAIAVPLVMPAPWPAATALGAGVILWLSTAWSLFGPAPASPDTASLSAT